MGQAEENLSYSGKTRQQRGAARRSRMAPMTASARKNSIRQRSHAGRRVAWLCVGADDCQYTKNSIRQRSNSCPKKKSDRLGKTRGCH